MNETTKNYHLFNEHLQEKLKLIHLHAEEQRVYFSVSIAQNAHYHLIEKMCLNNTN